MHALRLSLLVIITSSGVAVAEDYACPGVTTCPFEQTVPQGCPVHFVLAANVVPADVRATVERGGQTVDVTGAATTTRVNLPVHTKDYYSCDCDPITDQRPFDEYELSLVGVSSGETVTLGYPLSPMVTIGPAGACPPFVYETNFFELIACDLCTTPPDSHDPDSTGCASSPRTTPLGAALALLLVLRRRRVSAS
jgi:hypothetical protein